MKVLHCKDAVFVEPSALAVLRKGGEKRPGKSQATYTNLHFLVSLILHTESSPADRKVERKGGQGNG